MNYNFMRLIVLFDLPVKTKKDRKIYALFRKELIKRGYLMLQYSVYAKVLANREAAVLEKNIVRKIAPEKGNIRMMMLTENQYQNIEIIIGGISNQEEVLTKEAFIII